MKSRMSCAYVVALCGVACGCLFASEPERVIAVSPGDEALRQALAQVADLRRTDPAATVVLSLAPGDYALSGTLVVDARHAPPAGGGLRIRAADSARLPRLLGGAEGFRVAEGTVWR